MLRGHTWVVFRGRAPSRQHSSFGPISLSCALSNSVSDCEKGRLADQILLFIITALEGCFSAELLSMQPPSSTTRPSLSNYSILVSLVMMGDEDNRNISRVHYQRERIWYVGMKFVPISVRKVSIFIFCWKINNTPNEQIQCCTQ